MADNETQLFVVAKQSTDAPGEERYSRKNGNWAAELPVPVKSDAGDLVRGWESPVFMLVNRLETGKQRATQRSSGR